VKTPPQSQPSTSQCPPPPTKDDKQEAIPELACSTEFERFATGKDSQTMLC
jgi:hypothetical protein